MPANATQKQTAVRVRGSALMNDLEYASDEELIIELLSRFDHVVFGGLKLPTDVDQRMHRRWKGNSLTCAGIGAEITRAVLNELEDESEEA